tara:strand:+ start:2889 stop:3581 length:693 start_codon:yes stop_codon:yes gene_type:complete
MINLGHLRTSYQLAKPYPHVVINDLFPTKAAQECLIEMQKFEYWGTDGSEYVKDKQVHKFFTPWCVENIEDIKRDMPTVWEYLQYFNSQPFLIELEHLTGIKNLIADDTYSGGGVHKTLSGGKLSIHTDYSRHPTKPLFRRINLLIYLNPIWEDDWGGTLQLLDYETKEKIVEVHPKMNTAVIFNTSIKSLHGNPDIVKSPPHIPRYSLALYYFTKESFEDDQSTSAIWY